MDLKDWPLPAESSLIKQRRSKNRRLTLAGDCRELFDMHEAKLADISKSVRDSEIKTYRRCLKNSRDDGVSKKSVSWEDAEFKMQQAESIKQLLFQSEHPTGETTPAQPAVEAAQRSQAQRAFGASIEDFCGQTWSNPIGKWLWVKKGSALTAADLGLGFPASKREIERFGWSAKKLVKSKARVRDSRLFVEAVRPEMQQKHDRVGGSSSRRIEEGRYSQEGRFQQEGRWGEPMNRGYLPRGRENRGNPAYFDDRDDSFGYRGGFDEPQRGRGYMNTGGGKRIAGDRELGAADNDLRNKLRKNRDDRDGWYGEYNNRRGEGGLDYEITCYNCRQSGHHQGSCTNPPFCYNCKSSGHKAMTCPVKRGITMYGYGFHRAVFQSIHFPTKEKAQKANAMGKMTILEGSGTETEVKEELRCLFGEKKIWRVKEIGNNEFLITFPDRDMLGQMTRFKSFNFQKAKITAKVQETEMTEENSGELISVWVRIYNWPSEARDETIARSISELAGELDEIDLGSLEKNAMGPVRMKIAVKDPNLIFGTTEVHMNRRGVKLEWEVESSGNDGRFKNYKSDRYSEDKEEDDYEDDDLMDEDNQEKGLEEQNKNDTNKSKIGSESYSKGVSGGKHRGMLGNMEDPKDKEGIQENLFPEEEEELLDYNPSPVHDNTSEKRELHKVMKNDNITVMEEDDQETVIDKEVNCLEQQKKQMAQLDMAFEKRIEKLNDVVNIPIPITDPAMVEDTQNDWELSSQVLNENENQDTKGLRDYIIPGKKSSRIKEDGRTIQAKAEEKKAKREMIELEQVVEGKRQGNLGRAGGVY